VRAAAVAGLVCIGLAAQPRISRPVHAWEFADATGPRAGLFGNEQGTLEAFVYPLKIFRDFRLVFYSGGHEIPAASVARRIVSVPGIYTIVYTGDDFRVSEHLSVPRDSSGALFQLEIEAQNPLRVDLRFTRDFQLMWPASFGAAYGEWREQDKVFRFGVDGQAASAVLGSRDAALVTDGYATNYSSDSETTLTLGTVRGHGERTIAVAASMKSLNDALSEYHGLIEHAVDKIGANADFFQAYLANTVKLRLPSSRLQEAYDWSRVSAVEALVQNPLLGEGLVAGYGPSKGGNRPGFAWFFGRDSFWTSFALTSEGDWETARKAIQFVARFQRDDGKIPHEISQSASLVPWFKDFPYGYNAADSSSLYISAVRDYVQASGDLPFAREQGPRLWKAMDFLRSTFDAAGFPRNDGVGPGWVEGGPLLPVRLEIYQAGCYVEALHSLAWLARALNEPERARALDQEFTEKRAAMERLFWRPGTRAYAFALDLSGKPVDEPSVLATVPMWFDLLDQKNAGEMIGLLSAEAHASDWGMRILSSESKLYDPSGYHFGSVWPLFTGWASVAEYRYHRAQPAFANLMANAELALMAGGNTTEVLSGDTASPLSTASPHQTWSAAMVISPLLRGLAGLELDGLHGRVEFSPHLPADWPSFGADGIRVPSGKISLDLRRDRDSLELIVTNSGLQNIEVDFAPAYPLCAKVMSATLDGAPVQWKTERQYTDWHPRFTFSAHAGTTKLALKHAKVFGYSVPIEPPHLAEPSGNLKVLSEKWADDGHALTLALSGLAGHSYRLKLTGGESLATARGAERDGVGALVVTMPPGNKYVQKEVSLTLR
jgi:glycogen debranching enzyme